MARFLSQTLIQKPSIVLFRNVSPFLSASRMISIRNRSNRSEKAQLIEIDLDPDSKEVEIMGMRVIEEAIHSIIVRKSAPDWIPFVPGSSYWVPPRKSSSGIAELIGRLVNPLTEEENLSFTSIRGWPCSSYFIEGMVPHVLPIKLDTQKTTESETLKNPKSEDEEG